jgi:superfamily II DNA/RNA helicase
LNFEQFNLDSRLMVGIKKAGYETATPIQEAAIPAAVRGRDIIGTAQTGTGKTAAFVLPILNKLLSSGQRGLTRALIVTPTRELAEQINDVIKELSAGTKVRSATIYGGVGANPQIQALRNGAEILVACPGRLLDLINQGHAKMGNIEILVLDEADRMLDMGFYDDIMFIINNLPKKRQNLLFSATMPHKIRELARKILHHPVEVNISISKPPEKIIQEAFIVYDTQKIPLVKYLLGKKNFKSVLIFCSSKLSVKQLTRDLKRAKFLADEIHSDLDQTKREEVLIQFKSGRLPILVATDILSRGIDIDNIDLVINYDVPHDGEDYVHRIGRTARAEADGTAYTFVSVKEQRKFLAIEKLIGKPVPKAQVPQELGETPEFNTSHSRSHSGNRKFNKPRHFQKRANK